MKIPKYVIAPDGCRPYLTAGKKYPMNHPESVSEITYFEVLDDNGIKLFCVNAECDHLNGGNWITPENEA